MTPRYEVPLSSHFFSVNIHVQYMVLEWNTSPSVPAAHGEIDAPFGPGLLGPLLQSLPVQHLLVEQRRGVRRLTSQQTRRRILRVRRAVARAQAAATAAA